MHVQPLVDWSGMKKKTAHAYAFYNQLATRSLIQKVFFSKKPGKRQGRGSPNKQAFVIAVSTTLDDRPLHAVIRTVSSFTNAAMATFYAKHVVPESEVCSDGLASFAVAELQNLAHTVIKSESPRTAAKIPAMRWVNTVSATRSIIRDPRRAVAWHSYMPTWRTTSA